MITRARNRGAVAAIAAALLAWGASVLPSAGVDVFLTIKDASGVTVDTDADHSWVELLGFEHGLEHQEATGTTAPKAEGKTCTLILAQDGCLKSLMDACAKGEQRNLTLQVSRETVDDTEVVTELRFESAFITFVKADLGEDQDKPVFRVGLQYLKLSWAITWANTAAQGGQKAAQVGFDFSKQQIFGVSSTVPQPGDYAPGGTPPADPDADHDGMLDSWETANGLNPADPADATQDRDHDGQSNKDEFIAGTNPNSGASFFRATVQGPGTANPGQVTLSWSSVAGKTYKIMASATPGGTYTQVSTVTGVAGETSTTLPAATGRFFKVVTE